MGTKNTSTMTEKVAKHQEESKEAETKSPIPAEEKGKRNEIIKLNNSFQCPRLPLGQKRLQKHHQGRDSAKVRKKRREIRISLDILHLCDRL